MGVRLRNPKDFWAGLVYVAVGAGAVVAARDYGMGTALKMGPAYFPTVLGAALVLIGLLSLGRSLVRDGEAVTAFAGRGMVLVLGATLLAGFLARNAGMVFALPALVIGSACAHPRFRWGPTLAMAAGLTAFCYLVFVKGLGIPMPLIGTWFGG